MLRKYFSYLLVSILAFSLLAGCQGTGPGLVATQSPRESTPAGPTRTPVATRTPTVTPLVVEGTISLWHAWQAEELSALAQVIAEFNLLYPEVYFDVTYVPLADLLPKFRDAATVKRGPTLLLGPAHWGPELYEAGLLASLDDLAAGAGFLSKINSPALQAAHAADGALIGLPYWIDGVVLFRNRGLVPDPAPTLAEMQRMSALATRGDTQGAVLERSFFFSGGHLLGLGGQIMLPDGAPAFNNETGRAWLSLVDSFSAVGATDFQGDHDLNLFKAGQSGFLIEGTWQAGDLIDAVGSDALAVDPWPTIEGGSLAGFVRSENLFVNANSQENARQAAWLFMEYFLSPTVQARWSELGRLPAVVDTPPAGRLEREMLAALASGVPYPTHPEFTQYVNALDVALRSFLLQGVPAGQALDQAESTLLQSLGPGGPTPTP